MAPSQKQNSHWEELNFLCQNEEWEKALKLANKVCQESNDEEVLQCRVVCNIRLTKYEEALSILNKQKQMPNSLLFEKAYCEYRLDRLKEALSTIKLSQEDRASELLAQILYKLEDYEQCASIYEKLMNNDDEYQDEHETNLWAVKASLSLWQNKETGPTEIKSITYEKLFNKACILIGQKDYQAAIAELKRAHDLCVKVHEEDPDLTVEDMESELSIICVQQAYVYQKLKRNSEALEIYNQIAKQKSSDISLLAVTNNNIVTLNKDQNLFDSKKRMKLATGGAAIQKMVSIQKMAVAFNDAILLYYSGLMEGCQQKINEHRKICDGASKYKGVLLRAAMHLKEKNQAKAVQLLESEAGNAGDGFSDLVLTLTLAQLLLNSDKPLEATQVIVTKIKDHKNHAAIVSLLVAIYVSQNDKASATKLLDDSVSVAKVNSANKESLERACANFHLVNGNPRKACDILDGLRRSDPQNPRLIAQLIIAYSAFDPKMAQRICSEYANMDRQFAAEDMNALEASSNWSTAKYIKKISKAAASQPTAKKSATAVGPISVKKKKKKNKLSKNFDPNQAPDPERWLPLRERSYYRGRRKNKKGHVGKGTQGAMPSALPLQESESMASVNLTSATPLVGPRLQKPAAAAIKPKQKKKKGNKW